MEQSLYGDWKRSWVPVEGLTLRVQNTSAKKEGKVELQVGFVELSGRS